MKYSIILFLLSVACSSINPEISQSASLDCDSGIRVQFDSTHSTCGEACSSRSLCCIIGDDGNMGAGFASEEACGMARDFGFGLSEAE